MICPPIQVQRWNTTGLVVVSVSIDGQWVDVIRAQGEFINERVESSMIEALVIASKLRTHKNDPPIDKGKRVSSKPRDEEKPT